MSYQRSERERLTRYALDNWGHVGHVIPYEFAVETLQRDIRRSALDYFKRHRIRWWTSKWDKRTKDMEARPTGHLNSSQTACVNHLEPARVDAAVAQQVAHNLDPAFTAGNCNRRAIA